MDELKKNEDALEKKMWEFEREQSLEQIAKKKIELSRIREEQSYFVEIERKKKLEVETIKELMDKQNVDNAQLLDRALKRAAILESAVNSEAGGLSVQQKGYMAELHLHGGDSSATQAEKEKMLEELKRIRQKDRRLLGQKRANQINDLQEKRA